LKVSSSITFTIFQTTSESLKRELKENNQRISRFKKEI